MQCGYNPPNPTRFMLSAAQGPAALRESLTMLLTTKQRQRPPRRMHSNNANNDYDGPEIANVFLRATACANVFLRATACVVKILDIRSRLGMGIVSS